MLTVITIIAILMAAGAPSFVRALASISVRSNVERMLADLHFSRNEAIARSTPVTLCRVDDPNVPDPRNLACASGPGTGWQSGWMVYLDSDGDRVHDADEPVLRVQQALVESGAITLSVGAAGQANIMFRANGRANGSAGNLLFQAPGLSGADDRLSRRVCISSIGRVRVAGDGLSSCGG